MADAPPTPISYPTILLNKVDVPHGSMNICVTKTTPDRAETTHSQLSPQTFSKKRALQNPNATLENGFEQTKFDVFLNILKITSLFVVKKESLFFWSTQRCFSLKTQLYIILIERLLLSSFVNYQQKIL